MPIEVEISKEIEVTTSIQISPILIHLNQKEIKYMLVLVSKINELNSTKPK